MNFKKLAACALGAMVALASVCAAADDGGVYIHHTFDTSVLEDVTLANGKVFPMFKFDGETEPFVHVSTTSVWESGWYGYDTDRNGVPQYIPTDKEVYAQDGAVKINFAGYNRLSVRIPSETAGSVVKLSFDLKVPSGDNINVLIDNNYGQKSYPTYTTEDGVRKYTGIFKVVDGSFLCIENKADVVTTLLMDNYIVESEPEFSVVSSYPEDGSQEVSADKAISFEFSHDLKSVGDITVNGEKLAEADYKVDGKILYVLNVGGKNIENAMDYNVKIGAVTDIYGRTVRDIEKSFKTISEFNIELPVFEQNGSERKFSIGKISNNSSQERNLEIKIIAIKDGEMLKSEKTLITLPSGAETAAVLTMNLDDITQSGYTVKALLWDVTNGIMPLIKHAQ